MGSGRDLKKLEAKLRKKEQEKGGLDKPDKAAKPALRKGGLKSENIIRLAETNMDGNKNVYDAIRRVRGISFMMANAIAKVSGLGNRKLGELSDQERGKLEDMLMHPEKYGMPAWIYNRRQDPQSGEEKHLVVSELELTQKNDIDLMRKLKNYRGVRHSLGLPVRGQRTRGSFRKGSSVGVSKKKQQPAKKKTGDL